MQPYKVLVSIVLLQLRPPARVDRERILTFIEKLAEDPFKPGDYAERDEVGNLLQIKIIGDYAITYWADHAIKEVKVVRFEKADHR